MDDCVFCRLIGGREPATVVYEDDRVIAFYPLLEGRLADGHVLVVPKRHAVDLFDIEPAELDTVMRSVRRVAHGMRAALGATGVNVLNASGPNSDQSVFHFHFHVIPRWQGDGLWTWPEGRSAHRVDGDSAALMREHFAHVTFSDAD
jgi:histidine triad (HIT) family protein